MKCSCGKPLRCETLTCQNDARYVTVHGTLRCALCSMGTLAIRIADIPAALGAVRVLSDELEGSPICPEEISTLRSLIGRS